VLTTRADNLRARAIRWFAGEAYSHVALVVRGGYVDTCVIVEADLRVRMGTLVQYHLRDYVNAWEPLNMDRATIAALCDMAEASVGQLYGVPEFFTQAADALLEKMLPGPARINLLRRLNPLLPGTQCSGLVAGWWSMVGLTFGVPAYSATPQDVDRFGAYNPDKYAKRFGERVDLFLASRERS
jgi:hypothetical protein